MYGAIISESCQSTCFRALSYILSRGLIIEALGLVIVTVFDVRSDFSKSIFLSFFSYLSLPDSYHRLRKIC